MKFLSNTIRRDNLIRLGSVLVLLVFWLIVALKVNNMLTSLLLAFVIYYLFSPLVNSMERRGVKRILSTTIIFSASVVLLAAIVTLVLPLISSQINTLKGDLPRYIEGVAKLFVTTEARINELLKSVYVINISRQLETNMFGWTSGFFETLPSFASKILTTAVLAPFFAFFMLLDGRRVARSVLGLVPNNLFEIALNLMHQLGDQMGGFIRARLLEAAIVGLVVWGGLELFDFKYAPLLALFAALTNLIPYIGPVIGAIPAILISMINGDSGFQILILVSVFGFAQLVDIVFIIPLVVAKIVDLHPVTVVVVIIIGAQLLGVLGMIISIPVASALKLIINTVFTHVVDFRR